MSIADRVDALIDTIGEEVIYKNQIGYIKNKTTLVNTPSFNDTTIRASIRRFRAEEIVGLVQANDRDMRISVLSLPGIVPAPNDKVEIANVEYNVESIYSRSAKNESAVYIIRIRGNI